MLWFGIHDGSARRLSPVFQRSSRQKEERYGPIVPPIRLYRRSTGRFAGRSGGQNRVRNGNWGVRILGVCNGFQTLTESGLLPGALMRNVLLTFVCKEVRLRVANNKNPFTAAYGLDEVIRCPVAHHDGNYFADANTLKLLEDNDQVAFRYADGTNPNGSINDIAGIFNKRGNILGMMPHPENLIEPAHGGDDGRRLFEGALNMLETEPA